MKQPPTPAPESRESPLAEQAASAKTWQEHMTVRDRLQVQQSAARKRLDELQGEREQAALNGTVPDLVRRINETTEEIASLQVAIDAADSRRLQAESEEAEAALVAGAKAANAMAPDAVAIWQEL